MPRGTTGAVQLFGGAGYTVDIPVSRTMREARIAQIFEGANQVQRAVMPGCYEPTGYDCLPHEALPQGPWPCFDKQHLL